MKYGIFMTDTDASRMDVNFSSFTNVMEDINVVPVFVDINCGSIHWKDTEGSHQLKMNKEQLEKERKRNIPIGEHVGILELLADSLPAGCVVMFRDTLTISRYPDLFFHIYQHFRNRKISVQFVDTYWLSSDILRCVGLLNQEIETQLILNLINNTYQNYERDNEDITIRYDALTTDTGELKKNR